MMQFGISANATRVTRIMRHAKLLDGSILEQVSWATQKSQLKDSCFFINLIALSILTNLLVGKN